MNAKQLSPTGWVLLITGAVIALPSAVAGILLAIGLVSGALVGMLS